MSAVVAAPIVAPVPVAIEDKSNPATCVVPFHRCTFVSGCDAKSMVCIVCRDLALRAPGLSCGSIMCGACCVSMQASGKDYVIANAPFACPCGSDEPCIVDTLVDRALERRIREQVSWQCLCGSEEQFHTADAFDDHIHNKCPRRPVDCRWCKQANRADYTVVHEVGVTLGGTLASRSFPPFTPPLFAPRQVSTVILACGGLGGKESERAA
jgi:hypothetical protein